MPSRPQDADDPKGLIRESFNIEGISDAECRSIFVDWALSMTGDDNRPAIERLVDRYGKDNAGHPMLSVLAEGLETPPPAKRRGGRRARVEGE